jgi:hypothetical protein
MLESIPPYACFEPKRTSQSDYLEMENELKINFGIC